VFDPWCLQEADEDPENYLLEELWRVQRAHFFREELQQVEAENATLAEERKQRLWEQQH
jgi:hypothetical protein